MADQLDLKLSRKLRKIMDRVERVVTKEIGREMGIALIVFPWREPDEPERIAEYQYISNAPRELMREAFNVVVAKWNAGHVDIPPHEKQ